MELDLKQKKFNSGILRFFSEYSTIFKISLNTGYHISMVAFATGIVILVMSSTNIHPVLYILLTVLSFIISAFLVTVIAELMAHTMVLMNPNNILNALLIPLLFFFILFYPFSGIYFDRGKNFVP
jgi:CBS domain containing-hemolysin-like protein